MGAYFRFNHPNVLEGKWSQLKQKFFDYLFQCQEEWKAIKESNPLDFMPYMENHFQRLTGLRLTGLETCMGWIKPGSYYHWVVAQKGQLGLCTHLASVDPPRGPMMPPTPGIASRYS